MVSPDPNISIMLFLIGIISSRIGLWMADLVVTQLMQESVVEMERGVVNGVQNSLNMFMDMLKFALVIALPHIQIFGVHILLSFSFIVIAGFLFAFHSWRVRGHLFHFSKLRNILC
jgi:iron-regulated transporter 1